MNVLITGASGFIGPFLKEIGVKNGHDVYGVDIIAPPVGYVGPKSGFEPCDVRDAGSLHRVIEKTRPDIVFHLAAQSLPSQSWQKPQETMSINAEGTINLFESLRQLKIDAMVMVACSSAEYGLVQAEHLPVSEDHPLAPLHPYGVSKVAQDLLAAQYFTNYGQRCVRIRIFNTTGPGKIKDVCSDLTRRAVEIELGLRPPQLIVGAVDTRRAFCDVRDMARALWMAVEHCRPGEVYNVGAEATYEVRDVIEVISRKVSTQFTIEQRSELMRPSDEKIIWGNCTRFRQQTGWRPTIEITQTVSDMLSWWRVRLADGSTTANTIATTALRGN